MKNETPIGKIIYEYLKEKEKQLSFSLKRPLKVLERVLKPRRGSAESLIEEKNVLEDVSPVKKFKFNHSVTIGNIGGNGNNLGSKKIDKELKA